MLPTKNRNLLRHMFEQSAPYALTKSWPTYDGKELDRTAYLTSSETGACLRKAWYDKNTAGSFSGNGFTERGNAVEEWFVQRLLPLRTLGYGVEYVGSQQRSFYLEELGLAGTPDGIITIPNGGGDNGERVLIEIKSFDPRSNKNKFPKREHILQVQQNMLLVNLCMGWQIKRAQIIYINASDFYDMEEFEIAADPSMHERLLDRAEALAMAKEAADLPAEGMMNDGCMYCQHTMACSRAVAERMAGAKRAGISFFVDQQQGQLDIEPAPLTDDETATVTAYLVNRDAAKEYDDAAEQLKDDIKQIVAARDGSVSFAGRTLAMAVQAGVVTFDKDKVAKLCEQTQTDIATVQKTGAPFTKLTVK